MQRHVERAAQVYRAGVGGGASSALLLLDADEAATLKTGQSMQLRAATGEKRELPGKLIRLDTRATAALGHVEGVVEFADPEQRFAVGEFVTAAFIIGEPKPALVVPESAVLLIADGAYVYAVNGTHLTRTRIRMGATSGGLVEVQDGLYAGDSVVVKGVENIWLVELSALKGGTPCCPVPKKT
jgi:membrane fusion protein, heavy metal efflux system